MVNVNVQLPPIAAAPFPQAAEGLRQENHLQSAIPKTEEAHAYAKMRDQQEREQVAHQSSQIIQDNHKGSQQQDQSTNSNQRRNFFFASKLKLSSHELDTLSVELSGISDYKQVMSVIQAKYANAVLPIPEPVVSYSI